MAPIAPARRALAAAALGALVLVGLGIGPIDPAGAAESATPRVLCVGSVGSAVLDETLPLAGRVRALGDERGRIVARSLSCPYGRDGRLVLMVDAVWVTRAGGAATVGPVGCGAAEYVVDPEGGSATLAEAGRQVEVSVEGAPRLVRDAEPAARLIASIAWASAAPCTGSATDAAGSVPSTGSDRPVVAVVAALAGLAVVGAILLRRSARSDRTPERTPRPPATPGEIEALVDRGPTGSGAGLPARLLALGALAAQRAPSDGSQRYRVERFGQAAGAVIDTPPARWRSPAVVHRDHPALAPVPDGERVRS